MLKQPVQNVYKLTLLDISATVGLQDESAPRKHTATNRMQQFNKRKHESIELHRDVLSIH